MKPKNIKVNLCPLCFHQAAIHQLIAIEMSMVLVQ